MGFIVFALCLLSATIGFFAFASGSPVLIILTIASGAAISFYVENLL